MRNLLVLSLMVVLTPLAAIADVVKGKSLFEQRCASCHGNEGKGDGPIAAGLPPEMKPRDLQSPERKVATDDAKLKDLIVKGGPAFGLNPLMAPQTGLSDDDLTSLIAFINSLKKG